MNCAGGFENQGSLKGCHCEKTFLLSEEELGDLSRDSSRRTGVQHGSSCKHGARRVLRWKRLLQHRCWRSWQPANARQPACPLIRISANEPVPQPADARVTRAPYDEGELQDPFALLAKDTTADTLHVLRDRLQKPQASYSEGQSNWDGNAERRSQERQCGTGPSTMELCFILEQALNPESTKLLVVLLTHLDIVSC